MVGSGIYIYAIDWQSTLPTLIKPLRMLRSPIQSVVSEQMTKLILKSLGVDSDNADAIAFKTLEALLGEEREVPKYFDCD